MFIRAILALAICSSSFAAAPLIFDVYGYGVSPTGVAPGAPAAAECLLYGSESDVTVRVGGLPAPITRLEPYYSSWIIYFLVPAELPPGTTDIVVTNAGASSDAFPIVLDAYAPGLIFGRLERGSSTGAFSAWSCATGQTPRPGDLVRAYAYGLGATDHLVFAGTVSPANPLAKTLVTPVVLIGNQKAEVVESVLSPGEIGIYRVTFKLPAVVDDVYDVSLSIGNKQTLTERLAIGNTFGNTVANNLGRVYPDRGAAQSIQTVFACGSRIGNPGQALTGDAKNPAVTLGGITVKVRDSRGVERAAPVLYADVSQVNYVMPDGLADGIALVTITTADGTTSSGTLEIGSVAPEVFMISQYVPAAVIVRVRGGVQTVEQIYKINANGGYELVPIDLGPETDQVYMVLFGTGWRFRNAFTQAGELVGTRLRFISTVGAISQVGNGTPEISDVRATFAGAQGDFAGLDQMNVRLPRSLARHMFNMFTVVDDQYAGVANGLSFR